MIPANEATRIADHVAEDIKAKKIKLVGKWMKDKKIEQKIIYAANAGKYGVIIHFNDCPDVETFIITMLTLGYKVDVEYEDNTLRVIWGWSETKAGATTSYNTTVKKEGFTYDYLG